jgi:hypothetical protein
MYGWLWVWALVNNRMQRVFDYALEKEDTRKPLRRLMGDGRRISSLYNAGLYHFMWFFIWVFAITIFPFLQPFRSLYLVIKSFYEWTDVVNEEFNKDV